MFSIFDEYIGREFLVDYWYDEGQAIAASMLAKFENSDWSALLKSAGERGTDWRVRCAEMMSESEHPNATQILLKYLADSEDDVVIAAADHLRTKGDVSSEVAENDIKRLMVLLRKGSAPVQGVLSKFLAGLDKK